MNGAAMSSAGSNVSARAGPDPSRRSRRVVFLVGARPDCRAAAACACVVADQARWRSTRDASSSALAARANTDPVVRARARRSTHATASPAAARRVEHACASRRRTCTTAPSSSVNSAGSGIASMPSSASSRPQRAANAISHSVANSPPSPSRDTRAACPRRTAAWIAAKNAARRARIVDVGRVVAELAVDLRERRAAEAALAAPRSISSSRCRRVQPQLRRQRVPRTSAPARTRRRSATPVRSRPCRRPCVVPRRAHRHRVLADRDAMPSAGHSSMPPRARCRTARRPRRDDRRRAIQFAESLTSASARRRRRRCS